MKKLGIKRIARFFICMILSIIVYGSLQVIIGVGIAQTKWKSAIESTSRGSLTNRESSIKIAVTDKVCCAYSENRVARNSTFKSGYLMINNSVYYCNIPKCGSTFMGIFLNGVLRNNKSYNVADKMFETKRSRDLEDAYAFMFVREPYSRLFSAYENKFFSPNEMWSPLGIDVIREVRSNASSLSKRLGHDVSFRELVDYIVKLHAQNRPLNPHLAQMHTQCNPCRQRFDFIGRMETMTDDLVYLTEEWRSRDLISITKRTEDIEAETKYKRSFGPIHHMFWAVKKFEHILPKYKLFQRTWSSYQIRGMILKDYKMPFSHKNVSKVNIKLYTQAVSSAMAASGQHKSELKTQRRDALVQAYRTLPEELLMKFKDFVKSDCLLFGYDDHPELVFSRSAIAQSGDHDYFNWL